MIVKLETNPVSDALIMLVYDNRRLCKKMMRLEPGASEESLLFYAWFFAAQIMPGEVREHGLLNMGNMMLRSLQGNVHGEGTDERTPKT